MRGRDAPREKDETEVEKKIEAERGKDVSGEEKTLDFLTLFFSPYSNSRTSVQPVSFWNFLLYLAHKDYLHHSSQHRRSVGCKEVSKMTIILWIFLIPRHDFSDILPLVDALV